MKKGSAVCRSSNHFPSSPPLPVILTPYIVTLNLFQGPFRRACSGFSAQWMLKQVQHDERVWRRARNLPQYQTILTSDLQFCTELLGFGRIGRYGLQAENSAPALDIGLGNLTVDAR